MWKAGEPGSEPNANGTIRAQDEAATKLGTGLESGAVLFFKALMTRIRRNCESIDRTHLGRILGGEFLTEDDFE